MEDTVTMATVSERCTFKRKRNPDQSFPNKKRHLPSPDSDSAFCTSDSSLSDGSYVLLASPITSGHLSQGPQLLTNTPERSSTDSEDEWSVCDYRYAGPRDNITVVSSPSASEIVYQINWEGAPVYSAFPPFPPPGMARIRLTAAEGDRLVNRLKNTNLDKFHTLCKMHLSFLLHLPGSSLEDFLGEGSGLAGTTGPMTPSGEKKIHLKHFGKKKTLKEHKAAESIPINQGVIDQILPLVDYLGLETNIQHEGLFRKSGHIGRQKLLCKKLHDSEDVRLELDNGVYSAHDCASVLKMYLSELPEPVLTEKHYLAHCQIPEMDQEPKQLQTLQLLLQLLPTENLFLLRNILNLLHKVSNEPSNKMTSEALGTMFAPHLLMPRKMSPSELQAVAGDLTKTVTFMIDNTPDLFKLPRPLIRDIATYWAQMEESSESDSLRSDEDLENCKSRNRPTAKQDSKAITTTVAFADRHASKQAAQKTDTEVALAQLYAHVSSMPESTKKRRLLKQFNKANNIQTGTTPLPTQDRHKRTKSFGDSLKKIVSRNHKRRGSGHMLQLHNIDDTPCTVALGKYTAKLTEHTPEINHTCKMSRYSTSPPDTPVMRLFDERIWEPISPRVHIVDMKENTDPVMMRKRKSRCTDDSTTQAASSNRNIRAAASNGTPLRDLRKLERAEYELSARKRHALKGSSSPIKGTPDRRFERPVMFVSPITRTINKASLSVQTSIMTPGSRAPMAVLRTP